MPYKIAAALGHTQTQSVDVFSPAEIPTLDKKTYNVSAIQVPEGLLLVIVSNGLRDDDLTKVIKAFMDANLPVMFQEWKKSLETPVIESVPLIVSPNAV